MQGEFVSFRELPVGGIFRNKDSRPYPYPYATQYIKTGLKTYSLLGYTECRTALIFDQKELVYEGLDFAALVKYNAGMGRLLNYAGK
jgi:hypothetical protein